MKFVLTQPLDEAAMNLLKENGADVWVANSPDLSSYIDKIKEADALIIRVGQCGAPIIDACPNLKVIGITGVGYDRVDVAHASKKGIPVVYTPGANSLSVAEHTVALLFAAAKNIVESDKELREGNWKIRDAGKATEIAGKKIGIIGVGAIGAKVAALCRGIGMTAAGFSHSKNRAKVEAAGCEYYENLDDLLRDCDVISIHNPLTAETAGMISKRELSLMKKSAILINTSRGPIINEQDLADALNNGVIAAAAVDVFGDEPADLKNPVFRAKNMTVTPHLAALTQEAKARMHVNSAKGCLEILKGVQWPDVVDKSVYSNK